MSATCARNSDSHASAASRVPGSSRVLVGPSTHALPAFMHTYRSSTQPRRHLGCSAPCAIESVVRRILKCFGTSRRPPPTTTVRSGTWLQRGGTPMAVTRPPAHNRRRAATRTIAVALAATIAVGAAAVAIPAAQAATTLKDLATAAGKDIGFALDPEPALGVGLQVHRRQRVQPRRRRERDEVGRHRAVAELVQLRLRRPGGQLRRQHRQGALRPHARVALADAGLDQQPVRDGPRVGDEEPRHQRRDALQGQGLVVGRGQRGVRRATASAAPTRRSSRRSATGTSRPRSGRRGPRTRTPSSASTTTTPTPSTPRAPRSTTSSGTSSPAACRSTASGSSPT